MVKIDELSIMEGEKAGKFYKIKADGLTYSVFGGTDAFD